MNSRSTIVPTGLTSTRLAMGACFAIIVPWSRGGNWATWVSLALVGLIELSDLLDGIMARRLNLVSDFGKMFDPYADSVSRLLVYWSLARVGRCIEVLPLVMAIRDITVSYIRVWGAMNASDVSARLTGKLKAVVQGIGAAVLTSGPLYWGHRSGTVIFWISLAVLIVTVVSLADYSIAARRAGGPDAKADSQQEPDSES